LVFCNSIGDAIQVQTLRLKYRYPVLEKLGLPRAVKLPGPRHTRASILRGAGVNPKMRQQRTPSPLASQSGFQISVRENWAKHARSNLTVNPNCKPA
jgi:hypothetical protein